LPSESNELVERGLDHCPPLLLVLFRWRHLVDLLIVHLEVPGLPGRDLAWCPAQHPRAVRCREHEDVDSGHQVPFAVLIEAEGMAVSEDALNGASMPIHLLVDEVQGAITVEGVWPPPAHLFPPFSVAMCMPVE